ncbi:MAG: ABC transporter substrate-binding protein [Alphaproteobacteria bacterium]|nr:ABC transporter substrate-binding protein [Alphaproteobacteria bacterium]
MKSNSFLYFILFCGILLFSSTVYSKNLSLKEAEKFAYERGNELLSSFDIADSKQKYEKLDHLLLEYVDLSYIAKFVMGKYWREMSLEQQKKYLDLFQSYALNLYRGFPLEFSDRVSFEIADSEVVNDDVMVTAIITVKGQNDADSMNIAVNFRIHNNDDKVMIRDIKVGENSLILVYRQRFQEMMKEADEDINWFLEDFELLANSVEKKS